MSFEETSHPSGGREAAGVVIRAETVDGNGMLLIDNHGEDGTAGAQGPKGATGGQGRRGGVGLPGGEGGRGGDVILDVRTGLGKINVQNLAGGSGGSGGPGGDGGDGGPGGKAAPGTLHWARDQARSSESSIARRKT